MKRLLVLMMLILAILVGCGVNDSPTVVEGVNKLSATEIVDKVEDNGTYAFILGNDSCPACRTYKGNLKKLVEEEGITLDYIDLLEEEEDNFEAVNVLLVDKLNVDVSDGIATPTTFIVKDGNVVDQIVGSVSAGELMSEHGEHLKEMK